jgi:hypothetical protein
VTAVDARGDTARAIAEENEFDDITEIFDAFARDPSVFVEKRACPVKTKTGRCPGEDNGSCPHEHTPCDHHVARFGSCTRTNCNQVHYVDEIYRNFIDCAMCLEPCTGHTVDLSCGHIFHRDCISSWLSDSRTCPTCRAEI